jgi:hypothetical protein
LLGQYSDDEEEEGAVDQPIGEAKGSPADANSKVIEGLALFFFFSLVHYSLALSSGLHAAWARPSRSNLVLLI